MDSYTFALYSKILRTFWRVFLVVLGIAFVIVVFPYVKDVLIMIIVAGTLSVLLSPMVDFLESKGFRRGWAILVVMTLILLLIAFAISLIVPRIIHAIESLTPLFQSSTISGFSTKIEGFFEKNFHNVELARNVTAKVNEITVNLLGSLGNLLKSVSSFLASMFIIPVITFFLIKDTRRFKKAIISQVPNKYFELSLSILHKVGNQVGKYIQGQAIDAMIVAALSTIGLFIINLVFGGPIPYFVFIGMLAGLANVIPYVGPIVGAIPALVIVLLNNPPQLAMVLIWTAAVFFIVQAIDSAFISPLVVSKSVNMHPLTVIVVIIIGGKIAGALGMLLAVPFTGIIKVIFSQILWGLSNYRISAPPLLEGSSSTKAESIEIRQR
jgi:predicted PurR-regulated permease PerM